MSAELDGDKWIVDCAEGKFALTVTGYDMSVAPIDDAPTPTPSPPPGKDKVGPTRRQGQGLSQPRGIRSPRFGLSHGETPTVGLR